MKTKPFLLATAGSTVDGRNIDAAMLEDMASSYNPKTYGARLNIEHIKGISPDGPFRAYGDVVSLTTGDVEVDFNGKTEIRRGLYGVLDVTDDAKALNVAAQKLYPSIEIEPNFAGKGFAYLMGCALTDSPAAIGTERMQFNRHLPSSLSLHSDEARALEFAEEETKSAAFDEIRHFFARVSAMLTGQDNDPVAGGDPAGDPVNPPADPATNPAANPAAKPAGNLDLARFASELSQSLERAFAAQDAALKDALTAHSKRLDTLEEAAATTPHPNHHARPLASGVSGAMDFSQVF